MGYKSLRKNGREREKKGLKKNAKTPALASLPIRRAVSKYRREGKNVARQTVVI